MTLPCPIQRPLIFFDLETTGLDFKYDRIIELGALKFYPDGKEETYLERINPAMRIPIEVTHLTGISNEHVKDLPTFKDRVDEIEAFFKDSDVGGYNILRFDTKMMMEEFNRCQRDFRLGDRAIVDAQIIFHQKERRDLAAAYKFYCNKDLKSAHSAAADTAATLEIWKAQLERYADLPKDVKEIDKLCRTDNERFVDSEGKFFWRDGEAVFNFGRYKSHSLRSVVQQDPGYLDWVISPQRNFSQDVVDICYDAMKGKYPLKVEK